MIHMQTEPPMLPINNSFLRPSLSIRKKSQIRVKHVLTTPNNPVVRKEVFVPVIPMDAKTVGE